MATISVEVPTKLYKELETVCSITNGSVEKELENAVERCVASYRNQDGVVKPVKAIYLEHVCEAEVQAYKNAGKEVPSVKERSCFFLYHTTIFSMPYAAIVLDGQFMKVPAQCVAFPS